MKAFKYKGLDSYGARIEGETQGGNIEEVERRLVGQSITIISIIPAGMGKKGAAGESASGGRGVARGRKKISDADAAGILRNLSVMAETGVPFVEALDAVATSARTPQMTTDLLQLKAEIVGGKSLSAAIRNTPELFPEIIADMITVAEEGGQLDKALATAASYLERSADLRKRIINAMLYPMVMLSVSALTVGVLIVFVMPRFASIFLKMKADIPMSTKVLLAIGDFVRGNPIQTVVGMVVLFFAMRHLLRMPNVAPWVSKTMLRVPLLGVLLQNLALSRAFQSIATLLSSNVALMGALDHGAKVAGNKTVTEALLRARTAVEHGGAFSDALAETGTFPKMLVQMVAVGERSGRLAQLLTSFAARMEEEVDARLKALVSIVEPLMIVVMGLIVGVITTSIILPIYSVVQNIK